MSAEKTVVLCAVALTPDLVGRGDPAAEGVRRRRRAGARRRRHAGRDRHRAEHLPDRAAAERARRGRQRLAVPRHDGGAAVAAVEPARAGAQGVGGGPGHHLREPLLVVRHVLVGRRDGHAAADVPGRRPQDPRLLHEAGRAARRAAGRARPVPAVQVLGPGRVDRVDAVDRRGGQARRGAPSPPTSRSSTCPTSTTGCRRRARPGVEARARRAGRRGRRPDRLLRGARGARDRPLRVRHRAGLAPGAPQPRAARGGADRLPDGARARGARRRRQRGVRGGRPPARARLRARPGAGAGGAGAARGRAGRRRGARRGGQARATGSTTSAPASWC